MDALAENNVQKESGDYGIFPVLLCARKCPPREPLGCCEGRGPGRGPQEAEKAPEKQLASPPDYDLRQKPGSSQWMF